MTRGISRDGIHCNCSQAHKQQSGCTGKRPRTERVAPLNAFTDHVRALAIEGFRKIQIAYDSIYYHIFIYILDCSSTLKLSSDLDTCLREDKSLHQVLLRDFGLLEEVDAAVDRADRDLRIRDEDRGLKAV